MSTDKELSEVRAVSSEFVRIAAAARYYAPGPAESLHVGNPALSDEDIEYGLKRANEIWDHHGDPVGPLPLNQLQLAAIIASARNEGRHT